MRLEDHNLLLVRLMLKSAETGNPLLVYALQRVKGEIAKRFIVEIICSPNLLLIRDSNYRYPTQVYSETARFVHDTLKFHDLLTKAEKWSHAEKEKYLKSSYDVKAIKKSKSYSNAYKTKSINVRNIEISKTAQILFGDSEIAKF